MHGTSKLRPENLLVIALVILGLALLGALILVLPGSTSDDPSAGRPWGAALVVLLTGAAVAGLLLAWARRIRRQHRPEWLETQAWQQKTAEKVREGTGGPKAAGREPPGQR